MRTGMFLFVVIMVLGIHEVAEGLSNHVDLFNLDDQRYGHRGTHCNV